MIGPKVSKWTSWSQENDGREMVKFRDSGVCVRCGLVDPLFGVNHDHRRNRSQGGDWSPSNGQLLCGSGTTGCHGWRTSYPHDAARNGYAVPGWADWREWPAQRWAKSRHGEYRQVWVLYDDEGTWREIGVLEAMERMGVAA